MRILIVNDQLLHYLSEHVVGRGVVPVLNQDGFLTACGFPNFCVRVAEIGEEVVQLLSDQCYLGYCPRNSRIARFFSGEPAISKLPG